MATYKVNQLIKYEEKHPGATRDYTINMASEDGTNDGSANDTGFLQGRTISSVVVTVDSGMTIVDSNTTTVITLTASSGIDGTNYEGDAVVTLNTGEIEPVTFIIPVRDPGSN